MEDDVAATQNDFNEILYGKIELYKEVYLPNEQDVLICEKTPITKAYIARKLLDY